MICVLLSCAIDFVDNDADKGATSAGCTSYLICSSSKSGAKYLLISLLILTGIQYSEHQPL